MKVLKYEIRPKRTREKEEYNEEKKQIKKK